MAATRTFGQVVEDVSNAIATVSGTTCYRGKVRYPDNQVLQQLVRNLTPETEAIVITWLWIGGKNPIRPTISTVRSLIFINLPKDTTSVCENMYDFIDNICSQVADDTMYRNSVIPLEVRITRQEDGLQDSVAIWELDVDVQVPQPC